MRGNAKSEKKRGGKSTALSTSMLAYTILCIRQHGLKQVMIEAYDDRGNQTTPHQKFFLSYLSHLSPQGADLVSLVDFRALFFIYLLIVFRMYQV
ncbi:uncharacterized protein BDW47DRAFT_26722 [Aspergillus candidus]|uniref:Uncharacterized protein n=1 Tax=Aspergillus candidus TaxID=41067 RepID=A0A2I2FNV1_ASPCN|nr:hypothetical protein BDW47DRAFT_26722 [Aspergillus candidus]PLB42299.1 hypothetical protein BDW47DRAFT_26722 [Aspergillus candidus]